MIYYTCAEGGNWKELDVNIKRSKIVKMLNRNHFYDYKKGKGVYISAFSLLKGIAHSPVVHSVKMGKYIWDATFKKRRSSVRYWMNSRSDV